LEKQFSARKEDMDGLILYFGENRFFGGSARGNSFLLSDDDDD